MTENFVKLVVEGFEPRNPKLKGTVALTIFSFDKSVKCRKMSEDILSPVTTSLTNQ